MFTDVGGKFAIIFINSVLQCNSSITQSYYYMVTYVLAKILFSWK